MLSRSVLASSTWRLRARAPAESGRGVRWVRVSAESTEPAGDDAGDPGKGSVPKRAAGGGGRVARRRPAGGTAASSGTSKPRAVRRRPGVASERGKARTPEEKARAMRNIRAAAVAPRVAELAAAVADACSRDGVKDAQAAYGELKNLGEDAVLPASVFDDMLALYGRLLMPSSAEGVFIDSLAAGQTPTEETCWALLQTFERAGESTRAEKVLAYMESRGMN